jgi:drug/metabolite transporter (DMT)-like permease
MTSVASGLALEQGTTVFVFLMSLVLLGEQATIAKILAVGICIFGVVVVSLADANWSEAPSDVDTNNTSKAWVGDVLVVGSSVAAAAYMVLYKKLLFQLPIATSAVNMLLGSIGVWNALLCWPLVVCWDTLDARHCCMSADTTTVMCAVARHVLA